MPKLYDPSEEPDEHQLLRAVCSLNRVSLQLYNRQTLDIYEGEFGPEFSGNVSPNVLHDVWRLSQGELEYLFDNLPKSEGALLKKVVEQVFLINPPF